jgi:hypothetical protein
MHNLWLVIGCAAWFAALPKGCLLLIAHPWMDTLFHKWFGLSQKFS